MVQLVVMVMVHHRMVLHHVHGGNLVLLLPLHAPVLEPDFDLTLRQAEAVRNFDASASCQVSIEVKLFLQLEDLMAGVGRPLAFRFHSRSETSVCYQRNGWK